MISLTILVSSVVLLSLESCNNELTASSRSEQKGLLSDWIWMLMPPVLVNSVPISLSTDKHCVSLFCRYCKDSR
ncbi:hypothetical protein SAMN06269250_1666 [Spirosoma fluviale]|uniref:Uncharacterized protein n=1 Tax=Spirosoma fluviale TaxID=1597977 RepID=A0A286FCV7_9BACT|nr:hypothetical protein SAMN06269250_1666 [Spirosoma fluviale]